MIVSTLALAAVNPENVTWRPQHPIRPELRAAMREATRNITLRGHIRDFIEQLDEGGAYRHALHLSGEGADSLQNSRVSDKVGLLHPLGIDMAVAYVEREAKAAGLEVELHQYREGWGPNVIACRRGLRTPGQYVILGAHLDDIPADGRAPGANDDGSGSAALLAAAPLVGAPGATFGRTVCLEWYTGEEQGLVGSRAQADRRKARADEVIAMIQLDMIALQPAGDAMGVAFVTDTRATDPALTQEVYGVARTYADPELNVMNRVLSGSSCCSDHQSYAEAGFPAAGLLEPRGYTGDPQYHTKGDVVVRPDYSIPQLALTARVALAAVATIAHLDE